jgi:hypothetical protein
MGFYDDMKDVASELLAEFTHGAVTLVRTTPGTPDPDTPWVPFTDEVDEYPLSAVAKGVGEQYINGTTILTTDLEIAAAVAEVSPMTETDQLKVDGKALTVVRKMRIPAGRADGVSLHRTELV